MGDIQEVLGTFQKMMDYKYKSTNRSCGLEKSVLSEVKH